MKSIYGANNKNLAHNNKNDGNKAHSRMYEVEKAIKIPNIWNEISIYWFDNKYLAIWCLINISKLGIIGSGFCSIKNFESIIRTSSIEYEIYLGLDESDGIIIFSIEHQLNGRSSEKKFWYNWEERQFKVEWWLFSLLVGHYHIIAPLISISIF